MLDKNRYESLWKERTFRGRKGRMLKLAGPSGKPEACLFLYRTHRYIYRPNPIEVEFMTGSSRKIVARHSFPESMPEHTAAATALADALSYCKQQAATCTALAWSIQEAAGEE